MINIVDVGKSLVNDVKKDVAGFSSTFRAINPVADVAARAKHKVLRTEDKTDPWRKNYSIKDRAKDAGRAAFVLASAIPAAGAVNAGAKVFRAGKALSKTSNAIKFMKNGRGVVQKAKRAYGVAKVAKELVPAMAKASGQATKATAMSGVSVTPGATREAKKHKKR